MFGTFRKHSQPLWIAIIIVVVISFVVFFTPNFDPFEAGAGPLSEDAAAVDQARGEILLDEIIHSSMVQRLARSGNAQQAIQMAGGNYQLVIQLMQPQSPSVLKSANASRMAGDSPHIDLNEDDYNDINRLEYRARVRMAKLAVAREMGIVVSDNAVNAARTYMVQGLNGVQEYSAAEYDELLKQLATGGFIASGHPGQEQFENFLRHRLTLIQLTELMSRSAGFWPDSDMAENYAESNRKYAVEAAFVSLTNHTVSATNHVDISKAAGFTNYWNTIANQYQVPVRHTIAYVKLTLADFEADVRKAEKFDDEVQKLVEQHNTTTNKFTDFNGTALPVNATNLLARAEEAVRKTPIGNRIYAASRAAARARSVDFRKALFSKRPYATANLADTAKQFNLPVQTATFSQEDSPGDVPTELIQAAFASSLKEGALLESAVYVNSATRTSEVESIYILGLEMIIPLELRKYTALTDDEKEKVHEGFLESETKRLANEAGEKFHAAAMTVLKEGGSFTQTATNNGLAVVTLPPFSLRGNNDTNLTALVENFVPLDTLQNALATHEQTQRGKAENEKEDLTAWLENSLSGSFGNTTAGYVLHITDRKEGEASNARDLHIHASEIRRNTRIQAAGNDWFAARQRKLDAEIIISSLENRRKGINSEITEVENRILYKEQTLAKAFIAALEQAGTKDNGLENWEQTATLKQYVREHYFSDPPKKSKAAKTIAPLLSAGLRERWAELDDLMADLKNLTTLRDGGIDKGIAEATQAAK